MKIKEKYQNLNGTTEKGDKKRIKESEIERGSWETKKRKKTKISNDRN